MRSEGYIGHRRVLQCIAVTESVTMTLFYFGVTRVARLP